MGTNIHFSFLILFFLGHCYANISNSLIELMKEYEKEKTPLLKPTKKILHTLIPQKQSFIGMGDNFLATRNYEISSAEDVLNTQNFLLFCQNRDQQAYEFLIHNLPLMATVSPNWQAHVTNLEQYKKILAAPEGTGKKIEETFKIVSKINKEHPVEIVQIKAQKSSLDWLKVIGKQLTANDDRSADLFEEEFLKFKNKMTSNFSNIYRKMDKSPAETQKALTGKQFIGMLAEKWYKQFSESYRTEAHPCILALLCALFPNQRTFKSAIENPENVYSLLTYPLQSDDLRHILQLEKDIPSIANYYSDISEKTPYWKTIIDNLDTLKIIYNRETEGKIHHYRRGQTTQFLLNKLTTELKDRNIPDPSVDPVDEALWNILFSRKTAFTDD